MRYKYKHAAGLLLLLCVIALFGACGTPAQDAGDKPEISGTEYPAASAVDPDTLYSARYTTNAQETIEIMVSFANVEDNRQIIKSLLNEKAAEEGIAMDGETIDIDKIEITKITDASLVSKLLESDKSIPGN